MSLYEEFLLGKVEADRLLLEFSFRPEEFADRVVELILNSSYDISPAMERELKGRNFDVETFSHNSRIAYVKRREYTDIMALAINVSKFENLTEKNFNYTSAHEAGHILSPVGEGHTVQFFRTVRTILEDNFQFDKYKELYERDIMITGDHRTNLDRAMPRDRVFLDSRAQNDYMDAFFDSFEPIIPILEAFDLLDFTKIDQSIGRLREWDDWNGRGDLLKRTPENLEGDLESALRVSRGRGKKKLPVVEIDLKTGNWEVLEEDRWFVIEDFNIDRQDVNEVDIDLDLSTPDTEGEGLEDFQSVLDDIRNSLDEFHDGLTDI